MRIIRALVPMLQVLRLPPRVARFYFRAQRIARREHDGFSLLASIRPEDLRPLLRAADRRRHVVELGTGTAWAAIALATDSPDRRVISYDPVAHASRDLYMGLIDSGTRSRVELRAEPAQRGPQEGDPPVELLFIDIGGHSRADTTDAFVAWQGALAPDGIVVFHDYGNEFPGVPMAVAQLGLDGRVHGRSLFICAPPRADAPPRMPA